MCYTALLGNEISEKAELGLWHLGRQLPAPACFTGYWVVSLVNRLGTWGGEVSLRSCTQVEH